MINTKPNSNCSIGTLTVNKKKKEGIEEPKVNGIKYDVTEVTKMIKPLLSQNIHKRKGV